MATLTEDVVHMESDENCLSQSHSNRAKDAQLSIPPSTKFTSFLRDWRNLCEEVQWFNATVVFVTPLLAIYGSFTTPVNNKTVAFSTLCYLLNMISITAGYHRLWSHRAYNASSILQYFYAIAGAGAVQGSILWWARRHRSHHRYTDTDQDPYGAHEGLFWSHVGWMLVRPRVKPGQVDMRDLRANKVVQWQHQWYFPLALCFGMIVPCIVPGVFWKDWRGGLYFACFIRITVVHHCVFSVNSIAHWLGETTYDDKRTPRDHFITALLTLGEGYHNFHHQFPMDYRNAVKWYQYDPTKWFITTCAQLGLASHLRIFPDNEIRKGEFTMAVKRLKKTQDSLEWPPASDNLPVFSWDTFQQEARTRHVVLIAGFIHEVSESFLDEHPGGRNLLVKGIGTDATGSFFGGIYEHSHAAHNLLASLRVGVLIGGVEPIPKHAVPPSQRLQIVENATLRGGEE